MPDVTFAAGVSSSPRALVTAIDNITGSASITFVSPTLIRLTQVGPGGINYLYDVSGVGITVGLVGGNPVLTGGLIDGLTVTQAGALQMTVTGLGLTAVALQTAITLDNSGANIAAVENLFLPLGWTYHGNANADILLVTDLSADGVPLNLAGNDNFDAGGGNDRIYLGDGDDTALGGTGNDRLDGAAGFDQLFGDAGNDRLMGGGQNDQLSGGSGADSLMGGAGRDRLNGGTGADLLTGNGGRDSFVFVLGDGTDIISDFSLGVDQIDLANNLIPTVSFAAAGATDVVLFYGNAGDSILLQGVSLAQSGLISII